MCVVLVSKAISLHVCVMAYEMTVVKGQSLLILRLEDAHGLA